LVFIASLGLKWELVLSIAKMTLNSLFQVAMTAYRSSHEESGSSEAFRASFGHFSLFAHLPGLFNGGVGTAEGDELFDGIKALNISDFGQEMTGSDFADTVNGSQDINLIVEVCIALVCELFCNLFEVVNEEYQMLDMVLNNRFQIMVGCADGFLSELINLPGLIVGIPTGVDSQRFQDFEELFQRDCLYCSRRGIDFEQVQSELGKDVHCEDFRESHIDFLFELGFGFRDVLSDIFAQTCQCDQCLGLMIRGFGQFGTVGFQEHSNGVGIDGVGFGFA